MKNWLIIIVGALIFIVLVLVVWQVTYFKTTVKEQVYIVPQGFKGIVLIAYDQKDGLDDVIEDGKLIYRIPKSGVLKVKRKEAATLSLTWHYFEDEQGERTEFYYCFPPCEELKNDTSKVFAFGRSNGASLEGDYELRRTIFLVGTANDTDSLSKAVEKMNAIEIIRNTR
jgi:hypothetical protein